MNALGGDVREAEAAGLAAASLALARVAAAGGTLWCAAPACEARAEEMARLIGRKETALPGILSAAVPAGDLAENLRERVRPGDMLLVEGSADEASLEGLRQRAEAWGVGLIWVGSGRRPGPGAADFVLFDDAAPFSGTGPAVDVCAKLAALLGGCLGHLELVPTTPDRCEDEVCITCSDEGRLGEVVGLGASLEAVVRTPSGVQTVDTSLLEDVQAHDVLLIHAGSALAVVLRDGPAPRREQSTADRRVATARHSNEPWEAP